MKERSLGLDNSPFEGEKKGRKNGGKTVLE